MKMDGWAPLRSGGKRLIARFTMDRQRERKRETEKEQEKKRIIITVVC
jgi:hypothetical protein